jgi:hypothetical protein
LCCRVSNGQREREKCVQTENVIKVIISRNTQSKKRAEHLERYRKAGHSGSTTVESCGQSNVSRVENGSQHQLTTIIQTREHKKRTEKARGHGRRLWYETKRAQLARSARTESLGDRKGISAGSQNESERGGAGLRGRDGWGL